MVVKSADLTSALKKKGFQHERNTTDSLYYLYSNGRKTSIWTKVSHGRSEDLRDTLLSQIRKQLKLDSPELARFVACPLTVEEYLALLRARGHISD